LEKKWRRTRLLHHRLTGGDRRGVPRWVSPRIREGRYPTVKIGGPGVYQVREVLSDGRWVLRAQRLSEIRKHK
jgi:hypothetical protein